MKRIYVTRNILPDGPELLKENGFQIDIWPHERVMTDEELHDVAQKSDGMICMLSDSINKNFLQKNSHLRVIANYAVGLNNIDLEEAKKLNVKIGNTPDVLTEATAETALGLMISAARNFRQGVRDAEVGRWKGFEPTKYLGPALKDKTLGVIGMGRIGSRLSEMARGAFNMKVVPYKRGDDLKGFLTDLDVLSLHLPLTPETRSFIGEKELSYMKSTAIVINTARGEVIDQDALYRALKNKTIFSAGLDVTSPEPLPPGHPLYELDNVIITPHFGSATFEARRAMSIISAQNILSAFT